MRIYILHKNGACSERERSNNVIHRESLSIDFHVGAIHKLMTLLPVLVHGRDTDVSAYYDASSKFQIYTYQVKIINNTRCVGVHKHYIVYYKQ
jgi:hypothetical protein